MKVRRASSFTYTTKGGLNRYSIFRDIVAPVTYQIGLFAVLVIGFGVIFSNFTTVRPAMSSEEVIATMPTTDKQGAGSPFGSPSAVTATTSGVARITTKVALGTPTTIPSKPSWVNMPLFADPTNSAAQYVLANPNTNGVQLIARESQQPVAQWFGDWDANIQTDVSTYVSAAKRNASIPLLVMYNIPNRDCGGYSVGGSIGVSNYVSWVQQVANAIGSRPAVVILEPDALGSLGCLAQSAQQDRLQALSKAVTVLKSNTQTAVYIDAGNPYWLGTQQMAALLSSADIAAADGFSLNVSYFASTAANKIYGDKLSALVGYKHYVIDTSRNGVTHTLGGTICNPSFAGLGNAPTTSTGSDLIDAYLWVKIPWESDGPCNGSPDPGVGYWNYAVTLAQNAGW